jgi:hypothetical protein
MRAEVAWVNLRARPALCWNDHIAESLRMKSPTILCVPMLVLSLSAIAQGAPQSTAQGASDSASQTSTPQHGDARQRLKAADSNGDRKLSRDEAQALPRLARHFDAIDSNHDGYITRREMRAWREQHEARQESRSGERPGAPAAPPPSDTENNSSHF